MSDWRSAIETYIRREARPIDKFGHQPRLYALARRIAERRNCDDDVLFAAAWLHDVGVFAGHRPEDAAALAQWDNVAYAVELVPSLLSATDFPAHKIDAVVEAIRTHRVPAHPTTIEGIVLRDADIIEQLGAIGILRTVAKVGRDTRVPTFTAAVESLTKALATLPAEIRLDTARSLAQPKIEMLRSFLGAVESEAQPALF